MNIERRPRSTLRVIAGIAFVLSGAAFVLVIGLVSWGLMTGRLSDTKVLPGNKLAARTVEIVSVSADLGPSERILYYYSTAMTPAGEGNLLTNLRVISYVDYGTDVRRDSIAVEDIVLVEFVQSESWEDDSSIIVTSSDGFELTLYASPEGGADRRFFEAIRRASGLDTG